MDAVIGLTFLFAFFLCHGYLLLRRSCDGFHFRSVSLALIEQIVKREVEFNDILDRKSLTERRGVIQRISQFGRNRLRDWNLNFDSSS